jgi:hypothetical protein
MGSWADCVVGQVARQSKLGRWRFLRQLRVRCYGRYGFDIPMWRQWWLTIDAGEYRSACRAAGHEYSRLEQLWIREIETRREADRCRLSRDSIPA